MTITKGLKSNHSLPQNGGETNFLKIKNGEKLEVVFLSGLEDTYQLDQVFFRAKNGTATSWVHMGEKDPSNFLDNTQVSYRVVLPVLARKQGHDSNWEGPFLWMQGRRTKDKLVAECDLEDIDLTDRVWKVLRMGEGLDTEYAIRPSRKTPDDVGLDLAEHSDFNPLENLGPFTVKELVDKLEERFGLPIQEIMEDSGNWKGFKEALDGSVENDYEEFD